MGSTELTDLVERLQPRWAVDEPASKIVNILRNLEQPGFADDLNEWIVANNALKSEAATALSQARAENERLREALELARRWLANCVPVVDVPGPKPLPVIDAALKPKEAKPLDMWEAMDDAIAKGGDNG